MYADFVQLLEGLEEVPDERGILMIDTRFRESRISYRRLLDRVRSAAGGFAEQGVEPGNTVLMSLTNRLDAIVGFLGAVYLGAIPISVPPALMSQDRRCHLRRIATLYADQALDAYLASPELAELDVGSGVRVPDAENACRRVGPAAVRGDDVVFVQFSSGSTSQPKGVRITHRNLMHNLDWILANDLRTPEDVFVSWLPLCHDMGLVGGLLSNLVRGNDLVLMDPRCFIARPVSWLERISRHRGTVTAIPNFALDICADRVTDDQLEGHGIDLSSFRYIYCGSEPVRVESIERFEARLTPRGLARGIVYPVYGMSEATLIISAPNRSHSVAARLFDDMVVPAVGFPLGDLSLRIADDRGEEAVSGGIGEILVRGSSIMPGYLGHEDGATGFRGGWLATGDLGAIDEEGCLYVTGRKKDLIIYQGRNFYGHDVAARVEEMAGIARGKTHVFSVEHIDTPRFVVMIASHSAASADLPSHDDIQRLVLREFGIPVHDVHVVRRIPKTTSGKVDRRLCERMYLESIAEAV